MGQRIFRMTMTAIVTAFRTTACLAAVKTATLQISATVMPECRISIHASTTHATDGPAPTDVRCSTDTRHAVAVETGLVQRSAKATGQVMVLATITF